MEKKLKILILEDSLTDWELIERELKNGGIDFVSLLVHNKNEFEEGLLEFKPEVIISDHSLPQFSSIEAIEVYKHHMDRLGGRIPFILVTGSISEELAVQIIQAGADDYILKDRLKRLPSSIQNALQKCKIENEKRKAEKENIKFLNILQQSLNEIYIFNTSTFLFEYVNDGALKNLGYSEEEMEGLRLPDVQQEFTEDGFAQLLHLVENANNQKYVYEAVHFRKDKTLYNAEVHLQLVVQETEKFFLAFAIDITERKKHLSKIENQNKKLKEIARIQSHEIRGPLARIMGLTYLISESKNIQIDQDQIFEYMIKSSIELDDIIRKVVEKTEEIRNVA